MFFPSLIFFCSEKGMLCAMPIMFGEATIQTNKYVMSLHEEERKNLLEKFPSNWDVNDPRANWRSHKTFKRYLSI